MSITFKATSAITSNYLEGVLISVTDGETVIPLTTDENGEATYDATNESVTYAATLDGYTAENGTVEVSSDDQTVKIALSGTTTTDKSVFKEIETAVKELLSDAETALESEVLSDLQAAGEKLIAKLKLDLSASYSYYAEKLSAADDLKEKANYFSMKMAIGFLMIDVDLLSGKISAFVTTKVAALFSKLTSN